MNEDRRDPGLDSRGMKTLSEYLGITLEDGHPLLAEIEVRRIEGGEWLIHQGDAGSALYFLVRGRLQAWARDGGKERGRFLNEIVPGDSIGELSLLTGAPRSVGIQAIRDSLLIRIDRPAFEKMTQAYPALALRLAVNVANLVQQNSKAKPSTRNLKAICLLCLDDTPRSKEFSRQFARAMQEMGDTLFLEADRLGDLGAPVAAVHEGDTVPATLSHWLHDREDNHRFLVYHCGPDNTTWARLALRQSDLALLVGDAGEDSSRRAWEHSLEEEAGRAVARRMLVLLQPGSGASVRGTSAWLNARHVDFHVHVREGVPDDIGRVARIVSGSALGLVLAGGAARGFAHLGVYKAMQERGLSVDWVGGTSLGGIMAAALASPRGMDEAISVARESFVEGKPFNDLTVPVVSLIRGRRMERLLRKHLDMDIEDLPKPFFCVSCNLDTGTMNVHERGDLPHALRASAAIPGIIPPAVVNGRLAVDGAVVNNLPVDIMRQKPVGTVIAVDLSMDEEVLVDYEALPSPWAVLRGRYLPWSRKYRVPGLTTLMLRSTELGALERVRRVGAQADLLLRPSVRQFGMTEVKSFDRIVAAGYEHAAQALDAWLEAQEKASAEA